MRNDEVQLLVNTALQTALTGGYGYQILRMSDEDLAMDLVNFFPPLENEDERVVKNCVWNWKHRN